MTAPVSPQPHIPVMLSEVLAHLRPHDGETYVDGTLGAGGYTRAILDQADCTVIAIDRDPEAHRRAEAWRDAYGDRLVLVHDAFGNVADIVDAPVNGFVLDLGVSSMQLDQGARGFSFRFDGPLDMRMDTTQGETAAEFLARATPSDIERVIKDYGEERFAHAIAKAIAAARTGGAVATTGQLAAIVEKAVRTREPGQHPATRSFQALRIFINQELEELTHVLPVCVARLRKGGRLAVISFHSLEDRIVKRFMRDESRPPVLPRRLPARAAGLPAPRLKLVGKAVRPGEVEVAANPRARSAVMRVAERTEAPA